MNVVTLAGVTRTYAGTVPALHTTDLTIAAGRDAAIVGPSGSGKSTLLNIMGTLDRPDTGTVAIGGVVTTGMSDPELSRLRARHIGFVFQQSHLIEGLDAVGNVVTGLIYAGVPRRQRAELAREALGRVGLAERFGHYPSQLSGGERQRVGIARALVNRPLLVLADEPTGALDQRTGHAVLDLFGELQATGTTIALITHDASVAERFDRQIAIRDGVLTEPAAATDAA